ncbi:MAG: AsmA family protein [Elusimicrobiaceae bacterium]|nr:AsmA family protein [Elusimicrobiaceae bacterium]
MKKIIKIITKIFIVAVLLLILVDLEIHLVARTKWFNDRIEDALKGALGREIILGPMQANLSGISISGIQIAEKGGFEKGVFIEANRLRVRVSLRHLLYGHLKINSVRLAGATARLITYADGTNNWADLIASDTIREGGEPSKEVPLTVTARRIRFENLRLIYVDEETPRTFDVSGLTLNIKRFNLDEEFAVSLVARFSHKEATFERTVPFTLKARINLKGLDLSQAYADVQQLKAFYQKSTITLSGRVENFENPQADLKIILRNFESAMLPNGADIPPFQLSRAEGAVKISTDLDKQKITVSSAKLQASGIEVQAQGYLNYAGVLTYNFSSKAELVLGEIGRWFTPVAEPYRLVGTVKSELLATQQQIKAQLAFQEIGALIPNVGRLANVNGQIDAQESMDFETGKMDANIDGKLNANPFKFSLQMDQTAQKIVAVLNVYAKEVILPALKQAAQEQEAPTAVTQDTPKQAWPLPPIELKSKVQLGSVDVPYFLGKDILFTSDVSGLTPNLDEAHGTLRLVTGAGKIQDIYKLTNENPLTKVLFLSLNVTGKVFNSLNVLGVLNSLGSGVVSAVSGDSKEETDKPVKTQTILGPDGEPLEIVVEETNKEVSGEMEYDKFDTEVNFVNGLATIKEGTFVSPTMSFRLDGTADFNTGVLNMKVHAAPGRHEVDGMMPLSLKIGGTVDNPEGDMQVLGSVTSLVTQTVTNNVVSRQVKKGVKSLFGLFKGKEEQPQEQEEPQTTSPDTVQ